MRANQHAFFFQHSEIAANCSGCDPEHPDQVRGRNASLARENLADAKSPFVGQQAHQSVRTSPQPQNQADCATNRGEIYRKSAEYVIFDKIRLTNVHNRTNYLCDWLPYPYLMRPDERCSGEALL
jgi:hypothetical protein